LQNCVIFLKLNVKEGYYMFYFIENTESVFERFELKMEEWAEKIF
jgi:hypothetical protein